MPLGTGEARNLAYYFRESSRGAKNFAESGGLSLGWVAGVSPRYEWYRRIGNYRRTVGLTTGYPRRRSVGVLRNKPSGANGECCLAKIKSAVCRGE